MAGGGRQKGGGKDNVPLSLGDLVLAKVKGYPAWPAKISNPEDWQKTPDPKKYFVHFFGTQEIGFVAPADIQKFSQDTKSKLATRCQGKTVKYFLQAVEEICAAFDKSQKGQSTCQGNETDGSDMMCEAAIDDRLDDYEGLATGQNWKNPDGRMDCKVPDTGNDGDDPKGSTQEINRSLSCDTGLKFDHSSTGQLETDDQDNKPSTSTPVKRNSAGLLFYEKKKKIKNGQKGASSFQDKRRKTSLSEEQLASPDQDGNRRQMMNGHKADSIGIHEGPTEKPRSNTVEKSKDPNKKRVSSGENKEYTSMNFENVDSNIVEKRKEKKSANAVNETVKGMAVTIAETGSQLQIKISEEKHIVLGLGRRLSGGSGKRNELKQGERRTVSKESLNKSMRNSLNVADACDGKSVNKLATGRSLAYKDEKCLAPKAEIGGFQSNSSGDEAALPLAKKRRGAREAVSDSANSSIDDKEEKLSLEPKQHVSSLTIETAAIHGLKKRRAVRLVDEDDDERPKTPIHGGPPKKLKEASMTYNDQKADATRSGNFISDRGVAVNPAESARKKELSPKKSCTIHIVSKQTPELPISNKPAIKLSGTYLERKASPVSSKGLHLSSDVLKSHQSHSTSLKVIQASSGERPKSNPRNASHGNESGLSMDNSLEQNAVLGERFENEDEDIKTPDSGMSMKHLIAAAQAKRKQSHLQSATSWMCSITTLPASDVSRKSPSPSSGQLLLSSVGSLAHRDALGLNHQKKSTSSPASTYGSQYQPNVESTEEKMGSSGHKRSLSGDTEAAVARDAFEGMIETLSRTKESIGRATRLAIDCAKYGIAHEVVELLIRKLETESSLHRKVDLFFLIDSITQCSHSQKGVAGASYIPTVQAALPRLLAATSGAGGSENRRQCLKVLRLWLERKIFPESVLRRCMDDIGTSSNSTTSAPVVRRPSRAERAVDDPLREMEGMLVDEYGSNATFQLPGFLSCDFEEEGEEEEDHELVMGRHKDLLKASPTQSPSEDKKLHKVTPSDRRHCVLEDPDGDFVMEDVSGHPKDEKPVVRSSKGVESKKLEVTGIEESACGTVLGIPDLQEVAPSLSECFPPFPPDSPPPTPPLPSSPPPLPPSAPPPPSSPAPPLPPSPPAQSPLPPGPNSGAPLSSVARGLMPHQPLPSQSVMPPQSSIQPTPHMVYQQHFSHLNNDSLIGNQGGQMNVNIPGGLCADAAAKSELVTQQSSFFAPMGSKEPSGIHNSRQIDYGQTEAFLNTQVSQSSRLSSQGGVLYPQRPHQVTPAQNVSAPFPYAHPLMRRHQPNSYPPSINEAWNSSGLSGVYPQEGYFRTHFGRPPANNVGFRATSDPSIINSASDHGGFPSRPDISSLNCWPPT